VNFKLISTLQNWLVRWGLHSHIYCKLVLSVVDVGLPTIRFFLPILHVVVYPLLLLSMVLKHNCKVLTPTSPFFFHHQSILYVQNCPFNFLAIISPNPITSSLCSLKTCLPWRNIWSTLNPSLMTYPISLPSRNFSSTISPLMILAQLWHPSLLKL